MIKFPLRKRIMLVTELGNIVCEIKYAGKNTLKLKDAIKEMYTEDGEYYFSEMKDELIIDREKVIAYSNIAKIEKNEKEEKVDVSNQKVINMDDFRRGN